MPDYEFSTLFACIVLGTLFLFYKLWQVRTGKVEINSIDAAELRRKRFEKLSTPGDLNQRWQEQFVSGGLSDALRTWRSLEFPATVLMVVIEDQGVASLKLQQYVWASPDMAEIIRPHPTSADEVLAVRCQAGSRDAAFIQEVFHLGKDVTEKLPLVFFLYGKPEVVMFHTGENIRSQDFLRHLRDLQRRKQQQWEALGWVEPNQAKETPMDFKILDRLQEVRDLHRQMAEGLIAAHSASTAKQLIGKGVVTMRDFVVEDVAVGLDSDAVAESLKAQHVGEQVEREALRREQEEELAMSAEVDAASARRAAEEAAELQKQEEEAEAMEIWRQMDREHKLSNLPAEPPEGEKSGAIHVIMVVLPGGRRVSRRWWCSDHVRSVADFAYGSASDAEIACYPPRLLCTIPRKALEKLDQSLTEAGLARQLVLHASEPAESSTDKRRASC